VRAAQNHLLKAVAAGGIQVMDLLPEDYARMAELNERYADLPGDFADLTLVALSERLNLAEILTIDSDFDVYRRFRSEPFCRVSLS
jgi:predicted nucleic acid-binding protein